jgi:hypothetical protein
MTPMLMTTWSLLASGAICVNRHRPENFQITSCCAREDLRCMPMPVIDTAEQFRPPGSAPNLPGFAVAFD